jgi:RimJ/RimL family protein N-acetyltransferase
MEIRRLVPAEGAVYREIRLEALRSEPQAFGSTFEAESAQPVNWHAERLGNSNMFGAFDGEELVGIAGLLTTERKKEAHKGLLVAMYVRPASRRVGVGSHLVEAIIDFAHGKVELIQLAVVSENKQAIRLYARHGFVEYGLEKKALKQDGRYYDEVHMAKDLGAA